MAKFNSIALGKSSGSLGNVTLRRVNGENIASQKIPKGTQKVGTRAQVLRRARLSNLVTAYQKLNALGDGNGMAQSFPNRPRFQSNFNAFVKANMGVSDVAAILLPKEKADERLLIPAPFIVSQGTLTAPTALMATYTAGTYVMAGSNNFANVGELSAALINQYGFVDGDIMTIITQKWSDFAFFTVLKLVIDSTSTDALPAWISAAGVMTVGAAAQSESVIIRGRNENGTMLVSPAQFGDSMTASAPYTTYTGAVAEQAAADSYGYRTDPFLQSVNP